MESNEFTKNMVAKASNINVQLSESNISQFKEYMDILLDWNEKMNLTAITEKKEIVDKHFIDSLTINKYIKDNDKIIDIGTGAGFPGIPLKIVKSETEILLLDSLNKRINFLNEVINKLNLKKINTIHGRAEEIARNNVYRESYDVAVSRAVASLPTLLELMVPFVKVNGICICMKGSNIEDELTLSKKAMEELGVVVEKIEQFELPDTDIKRNIIIMKKIKNTPKKYPRKQGTPSKEPIG